MKYYTLTADTREDLEKKIENELAMYHPAGYGTQITSPVLNKISGKWFANVSRSNSCD